MQKEILPTPPLHHVFPNQSYVTNLLVRRFPHT